MKKKKKFDNSHNDNFFNIYSSIINFQDKIVFQFLGYMYHPNLLHRQQLSFFPDKKILRLKLKRIIFFS